MEIHDSLAIEDKWLLAIIDLVPHVEGKTRLQKFGILSFYEVLRDKKFFDDWRPDNYGGFSPRLAASLTKLESYDCIQSAEIITGSGLPVNRYSLTEKGKALVKGFVEMHSSELGEIKSIVFNYFQQPLKLLLKDVYQRYPDLTTKSKIIADVNKTENHSCPNPAREMQSDGKLNIPVPTVSSPHVFGDDDFREKLAISIGLEKTPDPDPRSFDRIRGILSEKIDAKYFDSEELVREVRGG